MQFALPNVWNIASVQIPLHGSLANFGSIKTFEASKFLLLVLQEYHLFLIGAHWNHKKMAALFRRGQSVAELCELLLLL